MENFWPLLGGYLFIFAARTTDVSLDVLRILMLTRDRKLLAGLIGFIEVCIFILALNEVLGSGLNDPFKVIAYAGGFATGNYVGMLIDSRLAMGYQLLEVFCDSCNSEEMSQVLRNEGFGVTAVTGCGRDGERIILFITLKRKDLGKAMKILDEKYPGSFYHIQDARYIRGGIFPGKRHL